MIENVPVPLSGVMLAVAATGILLKAYGEFFYWLCGGLAFILFVLWLARLVLFFPAFKKDLKNPVLASVSGTFLMGTFFISTYLKVLFGNGAIILWSAAIVAYGVFVLYFTWHFVRKMKISEVYTGYFIVYVGPVAIANTAPSFAMEAVGRMAFWFGLALLGPVLLLLLYRYWRYAVKLPALRPLFGIFAAPFSLCLVGYLHVFAHPNLALVVFLLAGSLIFYLLSLWEIPSLFSRSFYPSFASYTFPYVNSAIALKLAFAALDLGKFWVLVNHLQIILAVGLVLYVLVRYLLYFAWSFETEEVLI